MATISKSSPLFKFEADGTQKSSSISLSRSYPNPLSKLPRRIAKKLQLEKKTHSILPNSTTEAKTNFHHPKPSIYAKKKRNDDSEQDSTPESAMTGTTATPDDSPLQGHGTTMYEVQGLHFHGPDVENVYSIVQMDEGYAPEYDKPTPLTPTLDEISLMDLPKSAREKIYRMLLVADHIIIVCSCTICHAPKQPALTRVDRETRSEALPIFLGENRFRIQGYHHAGDEASKWFRSMSLRTRSLVKYVELGTYAFQNAVAMMNMYGFAWQKEIIDIAKGPWTGQFGSSLMWPVFKGTPLDNYTHKDDTMSLASSMPEVGIAQVARAVQPRLRLSRTIPTIIDGHWHLQTPTKGGEGEDRASPFQSGTPVFAPEERPITPTALRGSWLSSSTDLPKSPLTNYVAKSSMGRRWRRLQRRVEAEGEMQKQAKILLRKKSSSLQ